MTTEPKKLIQYPPEENKDNVNGEKYTNNKKIKTTTFQPNSRYCCDDPDDDYDSQRNEGLPAGELHDDESTPEEPRSPTPPPESRKR